MEPVGISNAKAQFSKLVRLAEQGEDILIARDGKPVVRMTNLEYKKPKTRFGGMKGKIWIADDFDDPLPPEIQAEFEADL